MTVLVLGIGGAGSNILSNITKGEGCTLAVLNTDAESLARQSIDIKLQLGAETCKGEAAEEVDIGVMAINESLSAIKQLCEPFQKVILVAGLGGGTGTAALKTLPKVLTDMGKEVSIATTLPMSSEKSRRALALNALNALNQYSLQSFYLSILAKQHTGLSFTEFMQTVNNEIAKSIQNRL